VFGICSRRKEGILGGGRMQWSFLNGGLMSDFQVVGFAFEFGYRCCNLNYNAGVLSICLPSDRMFPRA
jgi:hypothetical protein